MKKILLILLCILPLLSTAAQKPLPGADVFKLQAQIKDPNTIELNWEILPGYYLYRERIHFKNTNTDALTLGRLALPTGINKEDALLGKYQIYRRHLNLPLSVLGNQPGDVDIIVKYQGCADSGFCYPPMMKTIRVNIDNELAANQVFLSPAEIPAHTENELGRVQQLLASNNLWLIVVGFFGFGLLLAFTPCVLPMIPVLSGIILGHGESITTRKAFLLSLTYVLGMSVSYAVAGLAIALLGQNIQAWMQNPWVIVSFAGLFVVLALSMFGFYNIQLPTRIQHWFASLSQRQRSGHYMGVAMMGVLSTLILSPCVTAPLVGALGFIADTGNATLGAAALFSLGLGMGTPLLIIGTSGGRLLPKAGMWMNNIKALLGVMLLAVAILLLDRVIPGQATLVLWAILLVVCAIFLGALTTAKSFWEKCAKGLGILSLAYGIILLLGASMGNTNPFSPLENLHVDPSALHTHQMQHISVQSVDDVQRALNQARGKLVVLDFYADWCLACKIMEKTTFQNEDVINSLKDIVLLKADITQNTAKHQALLNAYNVVAPPTFLFFGPDGKEREEFRIVGEMKTQAFLKHIIEFKHSSL